MTTTTPTATDTCAVYLEALQNAMTRPVRGNHSDALQGFLTLNAAYFLGEWLTEHTHAALVQRLATHLDGIADLDLPADETTALQLAQHAREIAATFGPTRWTDRIIERTAHLVPAKPADWDAEVRAALATIAAGGDVRPLLRTHAQRRLWELTHGDDRPTNGTAVPEWALTFAYHAADTADLLAIQVAEAALSETNPTLGPTQQLGEGNLSRHG